MAVSNESKIDTKLFAATADGVAATVRELDELMASCNQTLRTLRAQWQGDASDNIRNTSEQVKKSGGELLAKLGTYPTALRELAGIYDKTEQSVQEKGKSLKFGGNLR